MPPETDTPQPVEETAVVVCDTCRMPAKVKFRDGKIVAVYAVCGHVKMPIDETPSAAELAG